MNKELVELLERELQSGLKNGLPPLTAVEFACTQAKRAVTDEVQRWFDAKKTNYLNMLSV